MNHPILLLQIRIPCFACSFRRKLLIQGRNFSIQPEDCRPQSSHFHARARDDGVDQLQETALL